MFDRIIYQIEQTTEHEQQLALLAELEQALMEEDASRRRLVKSLLYHRNWYIRREAAFLVDRFGIPLNAREQLQFAYALQNFTFLRKRMEEGDADARQLLFSACGDAAPRFRTRVLAYLRLEDCRTPREEVWLHYAAGDYVTLMELGSASDYREAVISVLQHGLHQPDNPTYHRKQCAFALEQIRAMDNAREAIEEILADDSRRAADFSGEEQTPLPPPSLNPLEQMLHALRQQGVYVDGRRLFPEVQVGTVTGRITYKNPPLQTWSKEERQQRIQPFPGEVLLQFDYQCIEPRILLHFLLQRFLISTEDIPEGDIYLAISPSNRGAGKEWLNAVINGGGYRYHQNLNPLQQRLWEAIRELRVEFTEEAEREGAVVIPGGRRIPLPEGERNRSGRIMNRYIQGTASEVLNTAAIQLYLQFVQEMLPARVYFLLFDEIWVSCAPEVQATVSQMCRQEMERAGQELGLLVPLLVHEKKEEGE